MKRIYTLKQYQYNTDKKRQFTVHCGRFETVRDSLSPCMIETREFFAKNKAEAISKARKVAFMLSGRFVR